MHLAKPRPANDRPLRIVQYRIVDGSEVESERAAVDLLQRCDYFSVRRIIEFFSAHPNVAATRPISSPPSAIEGGVQRSGPIREIIANEQTTQRLPDLGGTVLGCCDLNRREPSSVADRVHAWP